MGYTSFQSFYQTAPQCLISAQLFGASANVFLNIRNPARIEISTLFYPRLPWLEDDHFGVKPTLLDMLGILTYYGGKKLFISSPLCPSINRLFYSILLFFVLLVLNLLPHKLPSTPKIIICNAPIDTYTKTNKKEFQIFFVLAEQPI